MITERDMNLLYDALVEAGKSLDPNTKVGAAIALHGGDIVFGHNHLPAGVPNQEEVLRHRASKLQAIVHAEMDALCRAASAGHSTRNGTIYIACTDDTDEVWGGCPCTNCAKHVIQAGIKRVVTFRRKSGFSKWHTELELAEDWLTRAGVQVTYVPVTE